MRTSSLGVVFGVVCVFSLAGGGCREPKLTNPPAGADGGGGSGGSANTGGRGGSGGSGGSAGVGGSGGSGGSVFLDARPETSTAGGDGSTEASVATDGPGGTTDGIAGDATSDAPAPAPDTSISTDAVVMVSSCEQLNCPQLTALASECTVTETTSCESNLVSNTESLYCHDNGVKKRATRVFSGTNGVNYTTTMLVKKANGSDCYTLVMSGTEDGDVETWVFKSPAGAEVARGEWRNDDDQLTLICGGTRYVIGQVGCPGTDGEPVVDECEEGDCDIP